MLEQSGVAPLDRSRGSAADRVDDPGLSGVGLVREAEPTTRRPPGDTPPVDQWL